MSKAKKVVDMEQQTIKEIQNTPIQIDELNKLKFENVKLKLDILQLNKQTIEKDIGQLSSDINNLILEYIQSHDIPSQYRLDFNTMEFIIPQQQ